MSSAFGAARLMCRVKMSRGILSFALCLAALRVAAFFFIFLHARTDQAQWQLEYVPLWFADLPVSLTYRFLPVPWAEAIIGPIWWSCLPVIISGLFRRRR
jgi:hypothetical protein